MSCRIVLAAILLAFTPMPSRAEDPPARKELRLPANATREQIRAALAEAGIQADEAAVERIAGQLSKAKSAVPVADKKPALGLTDLQSGFKSALGKVRQSAVAVNVAGEASGVIISSDGLVLTAGHVAMNAKDGELAEIILEDGRKFKAEVLGRDLEDDLALMRITPKPDQDLPHCELAETVSAPGGYCFVLAHPAGRIEGRPAQPRIGRVLNIPRRDGTPGIGMMDCEIQPGDSGGPVFDLEGRLIGIASSAAGHKRFNRFALVDRFHAARGFLLQSGNKRGDFKNGPGGLAGYEHRFSDEEVAMLQKLLARRMEEGHQQTIVFLNSKANEDGEAKLTSNELVNFLFLDALPAVENRPFSYGLDDPALLKPLSKVAKPADSRLVLKCGGKDAGFALRVGKNLAVTADSLISADGDEALTVSADKQGFHPAKRLKRVKDADLALLEIPENLTASVVDLENAVNDLSAGDLLAARDADSCMVLGNAMDEAREIKNTDTTGPVGGDIELSKRRGPFPPVVNHSVPLYAGDAGTPVFTLDGCFAGMHLARVTRTYGVLVRPAEIKALIRDSISVVPKS